MASPMETDAEDAPTVPDAAVKAIYDQVQTQLKQHGWLLLPDDTLSRVSDGLVKFLLDQLSTSLSQSPISEAKALEAYKHLTGGSSPFPRPEPDTAVSPYNPRDVKTVERAWKQDYKDNMGLHVFKKRVELCSTQFPVYARVLPFVQSSGTGKSRLLDEVAKTTFTFPLCLRPPGDNGFPEGEVDVFNLLCKYKRNTATSSTAFFHRFLLHLFQQAFICFPIDPILAWAAFEVGASLEPEVMLDELTRMTCSSLIERAPRGELVTKFVLMRAYDQVIHPIRTSQPPQPFCPATLASFLEALGAPEDVLQAKAADGKTPLSVYGQSKLVLAQWIGAMDGPGAHDKVDVDMALQAALYSCGVQMPSSMPGVDHMLVFTLHDDRPLNKDNLLVLFAQTTNRMPKTDVSTPNGTIRRFTEEGVPVVFMVHEISLDQEESFAFEARTIERIASHASTPEVQPDVRNHAWRFDMNGTNPDLVLQESIDRLAAAQSRPFGLLGDVNQQTILQMLPVLDNSRQTRNDTLMRSGILSDLVPSHLPQPE